MKVLLVLAVLLWTGEGIRRTPEHILRHHNPQHRLSGTPWIPGKSYLYKLTINMTAGIPGMTSQVAKSLIQMDVLIKSKTQTEYLLEAKNVFVSRPSSSASSSDADLPLWRNDELERHLEKPIKFFYEDGEIKRYTLGDSEIPQSRSIKRGILRQLEMKIHPSALSPPRGEDHPELYPLIYNTTEGNELGTYFVYYGISVSPYPLFPYEDNVFNVSKTVDYGPYYYPSFHEHNNFASQGCPGLCKLGGSSIHNRYGAGCPAEYEPNKTPLKASVVVHHNYRYLEQQMVLESIKVEESSVADVYDQDIVTEIESQYELKDVTSWTVEDPQEQQTEYSELTIIPTVDDLKTVEVRNLDDISKEYQWIYGIFGNVRASDVLAIATSILEKVSRSILEADIESTGGQEVTQDVTQLQNLLALLKKVDLQNFWEKIVDAKSLARAAEKEKIMRQIFLDVLPLCGTEESVDFIKYLIEERELLTWEAKEVLEAVPANLIQPNEKIIGYLWGLLELPHVKRYHVLHSAAHLAVSRVIREACIVSSLTPDDNDVEEESSENSNLREQVKKPEARPKKSFFASWYGDSDDDDDDDTPVATKTSKAKQYKRRDEAQLCSTETALKFLEEMRSKMKSATKLHEKIIYLEAIAHLGYNKSLQVLKPYVYGLSEDTADLAPADIDFIKSVALYSLHNIAEFYPDETLAIVAPVYFNRTEVPKVRIAAFSVLIRCQPSLPILRHVAQDTWNEPSNEVGSYVYSALETFGNASTPCMRPTADNIKLVIFQVKKYDIGLQHSKSVVKTFFDELRNFGIEQRFELIQSNVSVVPNAVYTSLKYNIQSMKDVFMQFAANIQGVNLDDVFRFIDTEVMGLKIPRDIPTSVEDQIFGSLHLLPKLPKELRITLYKKIFYTSSYQYFDAENLKDVFTSLQAFLMEYLRGDGDSFSGHLVKTFIPSSIHAVTYSSIGLPVEFRMKHPLVLSLKVGSRFQSRTSDVPSTNYLYIRPCVYYATYHRKTIVNTADRHAYGVYHKQKHTFALPPLELSVVFGSDSYTLESIYQFPQMPKLIYRQHSETGTFETELNLRKIYTNYFNKKPIQTTPALFKRERVLGGFGLAHLHITRHTEDIRDQYVDTPSNLDDVIELIIDTVGNPGWRRRDINATIISGSSSTINQITFKISYNRTVGITGQTMSPNRHFEPSGHKASWLLHPGKSNSEEYPDSDENEDESASSGQVAQQIKNSNAKVEGLSVEQARELHETLLKMPNKIAHEFSVKVETIPSANSAELRVEYNTTYDRTVHSLMAWGKMSTTARRTPYKMCLAHVMLFTDSPCEFHYNLGSFTGQTAPFINTVSFDNRCQPLQQSDVIAQGVFSKVPSKNLIGRSEFSEIPSDGAFYPETHEECLKDMRDGKSQSAACLSAVLEESRMNKFAVRVVASKELPPVLQNITYKLETALMQYYFANVDVNRLNVENPPMTFQMTVNYIDKLTDKPVVDVFIQKPDENVIYHRIEQEYLQPLSTVVTVPESYVLRATNNTYLPSCGLMTRYVRTYDMEVYPLPRDTCTYVLSAHCTEKKKFAVLAKRTSASDDAKEITVYAAEQKVVLKPPSRSRHTYTVVYNERRIEMNSEKPLLLDEETMLRVYLVPARGHWMGYVLNLEADKVGIKIHYDGQNAKLQVNPLYKGQLCGLCSEFDGEITREYRGPDQCWYLDSEDFAHSSIVDSDSCGVSTQPKKAVICPSSKYSPSDVVNQGPLCSAPFCEGTPRYPYTPDDEDSDDESYTTVVSGSNEPRQRTFTIQKNDYVCFSTQPVPVCDEGREPEEEILVSVDYHCLPKDDITTRRLISDSEQRILKELANKKVDFTESMFAAKSCSPY